jgi:Carboxylesterase family
MHAASICCLFREYNIRPPFSSIALLIGVGDNEGYRLISPSDVNRSNSADVMVGEEGAKEMDEQRWQKTLRTYVQNTYQYHRQKIYDVLDHNYRHLIPDEQETDNVESSISSGGGSSSSSSRTPLREKARGASSVTGSGTGVDSEAETTWRPVDNMAELLGDGQYCAPTVALASSHASCSGSTASQLAAPTFLYSFRSQRLEPDNGSERRKRPESRASSAHGYNDRDLLGLVFGAPLVDGLDPFDAATSDGNELESDKKLAATVMKYFTNFVRTGSVHIYKCVNYNILLFVYESVNAF